MNQVTDPNILQIIESKSKEFYEDEKELIRLYSAHGKYKLNEKQGDPSVKNIIRLLREYFEMDYENAPTDIMQI